MRRRGRGLRPARIEQTEVGGVPCFWGDAPPPYTATLIFRVGRADETLATSGITHLAEHLLMPAEPPRDLDRNARVEDVFAVFWASGNERRALRFLEQTAELIADPPLHRLETERRILRAEAAGRGQHAVTGTAALRYGAAGHGLAGFDEYGLHGVRPEAVSGWIGKHFTRQNAALWLTGRPPRELSVLLPDGSRNPPPEPAPLSDLRFPAVFTNGPDDMVAASVVAPRSPSFSVAHAVVVDRAWKQIRYEEGLAYEIGDWFEPLTGRVAGATYWVESLEESVEPIRNALLTILADVAERGATDEELAAELEVFTEAIADPAELPGSLHFAATEHLLGEPFVAVEEWVARRRAVTAESTAEAMRAATAEMLLVLPENSEPPDGFHPVPAFSADAVAGTAHRPRALPLSRDARRTRLVVGGEGVSVTYPDGESHTVRWDSVAAALRWPDGARTVIGRDGFRVDVDPTVWWRGGDAVRAVDEHSPPEAVVVVDPEAAARVERVERAAREKLKRRWVVDEELEALPSELAVDEPILTLAEANRGLRPGLLVLTDRRLLWLYRLFGERRLELPYDRIDAVEARRKLMETVVEIQADGEAIEFGDIAPKERGPEIEALIRERLVSRTSAARA